MAPMARTLRTAPRRVGPLRGRRTESTDANGAGLNAQRGCSWRLTPLAQRAFMRGEAVAPGLFFGLARAIARPEQRFAARPPVAGRRAGGTANASGGQAPPPLP